MKILFTVYTLAYHHNATTGYNHVIAVVSNINTFSSIMYRIITKKALCVGSHCSDLYKLYTHGFT